jgi:hypothetical protein
VGKDDEGQSLAGSGRIHAAFDFPATFLVPQRDLGGIHVGDGACRS